MKTITERPNHNPPGNGKPAGKSGSADDAAAKQNNKEQAQAEWEAEGGSPPDAISQVDKDGEPPAARR